MPLVLLGQPELPALPATDHLGLSIIVNDRDDPTREQLQSLLRVGRIAIAGIEHLADGAVLEGESYREAIGDPPRLLPQRDRVYRLRTRVREVEEQIDEVTAFAQESPSLA